MDDNLIRSIAMAMCNRNEQEWEGLAEHLRDVWLLDAKRFYNAMSASGEWAVVRGDEIKREVSHLYIHAVAGLDNGSTQAAILVNSRDKIYAALQARPKVA